jgi:hypothetical protein
MTTLYRAAKDDYVSQGISFAESRETAELYLDNPGFGGATVYTCDIDPADDAVLDLSGLSTSEAAELIGLSDPGAIGVDEWIPRIVHRLEERVSAGLQWVRVAESYPRGTVTWIWVGESCDEPELESAE